MAELPVFHHPCSRRTAVVGKWGHQLGHPSDCPDCAELQRIYTDLAARQEPLGIDLGPLDDLYEQ
jgi:hypothetical protein